MCVFTYEYHVSKVDSTLASARSAVFETAPDAALGKTFARDFATRKLKIDLDILDMPKRNLLPEWESCVKAAITAKTVLEEEIWAVMQTHVCHYSDISHKITDRSTLRLSS